MDAWMALKRWGIIVTYILIYNITNKHLVLLVTGGMNFLPISRTMELAETIPYDRFSEPDRVPRIAPP